MHRNQHNYDKMKLEIQKNYYWLLSLPLLLLFYSVHPRVQWKVVMNWNFNSPGAIYPKETKGIMGILTSPLIHADWEHLFANTFPLLFYYGVCSTFIVIWALVYFFSSG